MWMDHLIFQGFQWQNNENAPSCMTTKNVNLVQMAGHKALRIYTKYSTLKKHSYMGVLFHML